jgi:hypothetical protein
MFATCSNLKALVDSGSKSTLSFCWQHWSHNTVQMSTIITIPIAVLQDLVRIQGEELLRVRQQLEETSVGPRDLFPSEPYLIACTPWYW